MGGSVEADAMPQADVKVGVGSAGGLVGVDGATGRATRPHQGQQGLRHLFLLNLYIYLHHDLTQP